MSFEIKQKSAYKGKGWWKWSVWVEAPATELDTIKVVTYVLHPTFRDRVRKVENRATKFRLDSSAWGGFDIRVQIELKDGSKQRLTHELVLMYPTEPPARDAAKTKSAAGSRIFLSSSAADGSAAALVKQALKQYKIELLDPMTTKSSLPWNLALKNAIHKSDAGIAVASDTPSESVRSEIEIARSAGIPVIRVNPQDGAVAIELDTQDKDQGPLKAPNKGVLDVPLMEVTGFRSEGRATSRITSTVLSKLSTSIQKQLSKIDLA